MTPILILSGTFLLSTVLLVLIIYLIVHSRRRSSEIISMLDAHHLSSKSDAARMKAEVKVAKQLADDIHKIISNLNEPAFDMERLLKTNKL